MRDRLPSPRVWGATALALVLMAAALGLAWWQYTAWGDQRAAESLDLTSAAPMPLDDALGPDDPFLADRVGQPVTASGTWVPEGTVYVSGREHDGREGYWAVTPLAVGDASAPAIPVVLGWFADLDAAPAPPEGTGSVQGWLQPPDGTGDVDTDRTDDVVPQVRIADLIQHVDQDLYGGYVVLDHDAAGSAQIDRGLAPADLTQLPEPAGGTGLRNLLYALEWVFFAGFAGWVWWQWLRDEREETAGPDETPDTPDEVPTEAAPVSASPAE